MSTLALSRLMHGTPAFLYRVGDSLNAFFVGLGEARAMAERFKTLSRMSDEQLARKGLKRNDIPQAILRTTRT